MPLIYVEPEVAFKVTQPSEDGPQTLTVYRVYGIASVHGFLNGGPPPKDINQLRWKGWYTLDKDTSTHREGVYGPVFEIRELPNFKEEHWVCDDDHAGVVQQALDEGLVRFDNKVLTRLNRN